MSDDYEVGYKRPPTKNQFKPGKSGNPKGRPRRSRRALIPSQRRRDVLTVADTLIEVNTPSGIRKMTVSEAAIRSVAFNAVKGKGIQTKLWLELEEWAINERQKEYPTIGLIELFLSICQDISKEPDKYEEETLDAHLRLMEGKY